jgi:hypothetical protein
MGVRSLFEGVQRSVAHLNSSIDNQGGSQGVPHFPEHSLLLGKKREKFSKKRTRPFFQEKIFAEQTRVK